jgi:hypothetical protein
MSTSGRDDIRISPQNLADAAGTDVHRMFRALPQLQGQAEPEVDRAGEPPARLMPMATEVRLACRCCMAAKGIFTAVTVLAWTDKNLCLQHQLWTGHGVAAIEDQADISGLPEIGQAQTRLSRLSRDRGPRSIWYTYQTAEAITDWSSRESSSQTAGQERLNRLRSTRGQRPYQRRAQSEHPAPRVDRRTPRREPVEMARSSSGFCHQLEPLHVSGRTVAHLNWRTTAG